MKDTASLTCAVALRGRSGIGVQGGGPRLLQVPHTATWESFSSSPSLGLNEMATETSAPLVAADGDLFLLPSVSGSHGSTLLMLRTIAVSRWSGSAIRTEIDEKMRRLAYQPCEGPEGVSSQQGGTRKRQWLLFSF